MDATKEAQFDTNKEERQGAWIVLAMFGVAAAVPPLASTWMVRELESGSGPHSGMGAPLVLVGLIIVGFLSVALGVLGAALVLYGLVRVQMHGPIYVVGGILATALAVSPVIMGWNEWNEPSKADFDPGDCSSCAADSFDGKCVLPWGSGSVNITSLGECRGGRRDGQWIFRNAEKRKIALFTFREGLRHGRFETETVRGAFVDDMRDGDWSWLRFQRTIKQGQYVRGHADGRWTCFSDDDDRDQELTWLVFESGRVVEGTGSVYVGGSVVSAGDAVGALAPEGIFCDRPSGDSHVSTFTRMIRAEPRTASPE